jgi:hypothetical protein
MQAGPRFFQSYRAIAEAFAAATMRGVTGASADTASESGAMTSSGWVSPFNVSIVGTVSASMRDGSWPACLEWLDAFLAFDFFVNYFLQQSDSQIRFLKKSTIDGNLLRRTTIDSTVLSIAASIVGCGRDRLNTFGYPRRNAA